MEYHNIFISLPFQSQPIDGPCPEKEEVYAMKHVMDADEPDEDQDKDEDQDDEDQDDTEEEQDEGKDEEDDKDDKEDDEDEDEEADKEWSFLGALPSFF